MEQEEGMIWGFLQIKQNLLLSLLLSTKENMSAELIKQEKATQLCQSMVCCGLVLSVLFKRLGYWGGAALCLRCSMCGDISPICAKHKQELKCTWITSSRTKYDPSNLPPSR